MNTATNANTVSARSNRWNASMGIAVRYPDAHKDFLVRCHKAGQARPTPLLLQYVREPGVTNAWSVRDIIAHVTTWEEEALKHLPAILEGRRPPLYSVRYGGIDAFNALMTTRKAGLSLAEVYHQRDEIHRQVVDTVVRTPDAQLACEPRYRRRLRSIPTATIPSTPRRSLASAATGGHRRPDFPCLAVTMPAYCAPRAHPRSFCGG
jgi:hypothetical protein